MPKKPVSPEDKARYGGHRSALESTLSNANRKVWMMSWGRSEAFRRSRIPCTDGSRKKFKEVCCRCKTSYYIGEKYFPLTVKGVPSKKAKPRLIVHHKYEVPNIWDDNYMKYLYCEQLDDPQLGYQILCQECHIETHRELEKEKKK